MLGPDVNTAASPSEGEEQAFLEALKSEPDKAPGVRYWLTRFVFLRALGFIYAVAFLVLCNQWAGLLGSRGILPIARYVMRIRASIGFWDWPTLFFFVNPSDVVLR